MTVDGFHHDRIEERFRAVAARHRDRAAIRDNQRTLSYGQLDGWSDAIACALTAAGARPGDVVAIPAESCVQSTAGLLGILKAGCTYLVIDRDAPVARTAHMVSQASCKLLLGDDEDRALTAGRCESISFPDASSRAAARQVASLAPAYISFTSGSTGVPKGILVGHGPVLRLVAPQPYLTLGPGMVIAQAAALGFDAVTFEVWGALLNAATLAVVTKTEVLSPVALPRIIASRGITVMFLTTSLFNLVAGEAPDAFGRLDVLLVGGETADPRAFEAVLGSTSPPGRLLHVYGPTETVTFASWHEVARVAANDRTVPIGRALAHMQLAVVDAHDNDMPDGVVGEIVIGGEKLADGYIGNAAETAARFVPDWTGPHGGRVYRSGDMGVWRDGALQFSGRRDSQVKIRGHRIELGEIEHAAAAAPGVAQCVVRVRSRSGERELVAHVVAGQAAASPVLSALDSHLRSVLPPYMIPAAYYAHDRLALTDTGKIDRKALAHVDTKPHQRLT